MIKNLEEIKRNYIRLCASELGLWLEVCEIEWVGPHEPVAVWTPIKRLGQPPATRDKRPRVVRIVGTNTPKLDAPSQDTPTQKEIEANWIATHQELEAQWVATPQEIEKAINQLLNSRRYFRICGRCRQLNPTGHMHDGFACQSCAEKFLGIVH